jgi:hypothetical protein
LRLRGNVEWVSARTGGQIAEERLDARVGHVLSIVRSASLSGRDRCAELSDLGYDVPRVIAELIELCEVRRFYQGESSGVRVLAYALTSEGLRELNPEIDPAEPEPWHIFSNSDRAMSFPLAMRCMKVLRECVGILHPVEGRLARTVERARRASIDRGGVLREFEEEERDEGRWAYVAQGPDGHPHNDGRDDDGDSDAAIDEAVELAAAIAGDEAPGTARACYCAGSGGAQRRRCR